MGVAPRNIPNYACGFLAGAVSLYSLFQGWGDIPVVFASLFLLAICITDTLEAKIPNLFNLLLILSGFGYHAWLSGPGGLVTAFWGLLAGFSMLLVPYLCSGMGAGDVKALAALGSLLGAGQILQVFLYMAIAGGAMSIMYYVFSRNLFQIGRDTLNTLKIFCCTRDWRILIPVAQTQSIRFPYAAAIAFGFYAHKCWGGLV
ncbi:MAG: A24 family peptidase [Desulfuromonadales bacterium]|nr:A24 family peptidase [Desulfuromonadales bacterium]